MTVAENSIPKVRRAITQDAEGKPQVADIPMPNILPGTVLVKVDFVALNPSDNKMGAAFPTLGAVIGCDFCGVVAVVPEGTETKLLPGDVVCSVLPGSNPGAPDEGSFTTYVRVPPDRLMKLTSDDEDIKMRAATVATALGTCTLAFWGDNEALNIPGDPEHPTVNPCPILVYGGSTATGTIALQLLRLSGFEPITTCSPHNFNLVRACGASAVFDYADPGTAAAIKKHTGGRLKYVLDCVSSSQSVGICYDAMARVGGRYTTLEVIAEELLAKRRAIKASFVMAYELSGQGIQVPGRYGKPPDPAKALLMPRYFKMYQDLLNTGRIETHPVQRTKDGFEGVLEGLSWLKSGMVSGKKLVTFLGS